MTPAVQSMVAVSYVADIDTSRAFYELLGFREHSAGRAATSAWLALQQNGHLVVLASTRPPLGIPQLPLLFYFFFDDVDAMTGALTTAGVEVTQMGIPRMRSAARRRCLTPTATPFCSASASGPRPSRRPPMTRPLPGSPC